MTQMQVPAITAEDTVAEIARQLRGSLTDTGTITSYLVIASAGTITDSAELREDCALVRSHGLNPEETVAMLEHALAHERRRLAGA